MHLFYCPDISDSDAVLNTEESAHCLRVLRLTRGDKTLLIDGKGGIYEAVITHPDPKNCRLQILNKLPAIPARSYNLHIAIAPTKSIDRFEWFIEKAVEIGVDTITPLLCKRSERKILKTDRLHKLVISTMKQAMTATLPVINEITSYNSFITKYTLGENYFIAHCSEMEKKHLRDLIIPGKDVVILIGPEGDFTDNEIDEALTMGFVPVSLGTNRLRTETAGIVACHTAALAQPVL